MVGKIFKQPNERYCIVNCTGQISHYNLTEQDIIDDCINKTKAHIEAADNYDNLIADTAPTKYRKGGISDDVLKEMGFQQTYGELLKFIPREPLNTQYASCDFATYGHCPSCGGTVCNGIGYVDRNCQQCGQILKW